MLFIVILIVTITAQQISHQYYQLQHHTAVECVDVAHS